ncbi:ArsR family transcriptional regulator, partial [Amycolatopsis rhizosphaerae]
LHHVRKLVETGFLEPQPARRGNRGAKEIPYLSTGLSWQLDGIGEELAEAMLEAYLAEITEVPAGHLKQTRLVVRLSPEEFEEFTTRLDDLFEEYVAKPPREGTEGTAIYLATYPSR